MVINFPERPANHQLEEQSRRFFRAQLPPAWICNDAGADYGADLRVGLVTNGRVNGQEFLVQIKASATPSNGATTGIRLRRSTYNYLFNHLLVVLLVKYVAPENEAYWLLLKDVPPPPARQRTFTVRIPRQNRLSTNPWPQIEQHVGIVQGRKLDAMRPP